MSNARNLANLLNSSGDVKSEHLDNEISLGDNVKATFGASDDLEIYHDGTRSLIKDAGTGNLLIRATNLQLQNADGTTYLNGTSGASVDLYHNNSLKLATTSTGIDVGTTASSDNNVIIKSANNSKASVKYLGDASATVGWDVGYNGSSNLFYMTHTNGVNAMNIDASGKVGIGTSSPTEDLTIAGTKSGNSVTDAIIDFGILNSNGGNKKAQIKSKLTGDISSELIFSTTASHAFAERMRIDSAGNVGIGTSSPSHHFHLDSPSTTIARFQGSNAGSLYITNDSNNMMTLQGDTSTGISFKTNGNNERMRIDSSGNVGIGTTSPSAKLQSSSSTFSPNATTTGNPAIASQGAYGGVICLLDTKQSGMYAFNGGTRVSFFTGRVNGTHTAASKASMTMSDNGYVGFGLTSPTVRIHLNGGTPTAANTGIAAAWNVHSDYRMKENIVPLTDATERLKKLKPCRFNWNFEEDTPAVDGFLAHEAGEVVPECASGEKDGMRTEEYEVTPAVEATYDDEGNELTPAVEAVMGEREVPDYQGIDQSKLVPLLVASLQEAIAKIEALEAQLNA